MPTSSTYKVISPPELFDDYPMVLVLIDKKTRRKDGLIRSFFLPFEVSTILNIFLSYNIPKVKNYLGW